MRLGYHMVKEPLWPLSHLLVCFILQSCQTNYNRAVWIIFLVVVRFRKEWLVFKFMFLMYRRSLTSARMYKLYTHRKQLPKLFPQKLLNPTYFVRR